MKNFFVSMVILFSIFSCDTIDKNTDKSKSSSIVKNKQARQLNISVLWDLSDRINPALHKETLGNAARDIAIIKYFADYFKMDMDKKGAYLSKGKLKVFFSPNPSDININTLASKLDIDLSNKDVKAKKVVYDNISSTFEQAAREITETTIRTSKWEGSDIYRFFKNDVVDFCISKDSTYRNILVLITDGYIYAPQSIGRIGNKSEYILPTLLRSLRLRNNPDFKSTFEKNKCGLISTRKDLTNLEILALEINSESNFKNDEDIIKLYLQKWFAEMGAKRFEIYNTDLPDNTKKRISDFLTYEK